MKKAHEVEIGESCRIGGMMGTPAVRVDLGDLNTSDRLITFMTCQHTIITADAEDDVTGCFGFEGPQSPENDSDALGHIHEVMDGMTSISTLHGVHAWWEERMKEIAAQTLNPGSDEPIDDVHALDYIWYLGGDKSFTVGQGPWRMKALDYYLGRKVEHAWGDGTIVKFVREKDFEHYKEHCPLCVKGFPRKTDPDSVPQQYHLPTQSLGMIPNTICNLFVSDDFCNRGYKYGIAVPFPCQCGKVTYQMFAIPGVHTGGFAYLIIEGYEKSLDVRNQCMTCEECGPKVKHQLERIDQFSNMGRDEEGRLIGNCRLCGATGVDVEQHETECEGDDA